MDQTAATAGAGRVDEEFSALPLRELAAAALQRAADLGAGHADFRAERIIRRRVRLSDGQLETRFEADEAGLAVRVVVDGTWGFASAVDLTPDAAARAAAEAVAVARVAAALAAERIELASEPAHGDVTWVSDYDIDPFSISVAEQVALLAGWTAGLLADDRVDHVDASLLQVKECKFYSDGGTTATQQRIRVHPELTAVAVPGMPEPPLGAIEKELPVMACPWSRFSDQVIVTVTPSEATVAELIVAGVVSTVKDCVELNEELAADESTFFARQ